MQYNFFIFLVIENILALFYAKNNVPSFPVLPATFVLNLNEALLLFSAEKSAIAPLLLKNGSSV